ncbi:optic atrophy 3 protein homolog [Aricia agestis]|uniref:optic atrophy 3 protein homolog n=1 Tax=Aricia agestis TaxID=91739 RepID=UPI001C204F4D|nr:optic atrophy 3 protein homolog [Aricia agestis]
MVVGAFPIAKLSVLLIKQISKPIANACKERAKNSPFFRTYVCMPPAQFYNWCEVKAKMWILNLGKPVNIPVLSQEMAIELGANLLGESVIFIIGAGLLIVEYNRQSKKESAKEAKREEEMQHITTTITDLYFTVQQQQTQLKEMERLVHSISGQKPKSPPTPSKTDTPAKGNTPLSPELGNKPQNISYMQQYIPAGPTPYPDKGLILQSLNYIQMDVFSSFFTKTSHTEITQTEKPSKNDYKREPAVVSHALNDIENNLRSLF